MNITPLCQNLKKHVAYVFEAEYFYAIEETGIEQDDTVWSVFSENLLFNVLVWELSELGLFGFHH